MSTNVTNHSFEDAPKAGPAFHGITEIGGGLVYLDSRLQRLALLDAATEFTTKRYNGSGTENGSGAPLVAFDATDTAKRGSGNTLEITFQNDAGAYVDIVFNTPQRLDWARYIGGWILSQDASVMDGGDVVIRVLDDDGKQINSDTNFDGDTDLVWDRFETLIGGARNKVRTIRIVSVVAINNLRLRLENLLAYEWGNGLGPVQGRVAWYEVDSGSPARGQYVELVDVSSHKVVACSGYNHGQLGKVIEVATGKVLVQESGFFYGRMATATGAKADYLGATEAGKLSDAPTTAADRLAILCETVTGGAALMKFVH